MKDTRTEYLTLDKNWCLSPAGYCTYHHKYITEKQMKVHRCMVKHGGICHRFRTMKGENLRQMKAEQYYDKVTDRLSKIENSMSRMAKSIEHISTFADMLSDSYRDYSICKAEECRSKGQPNETALDVE